MQKHRSWQGASEAEWQEACRREAAIRSLIEAGPVSHARADVVAKDLGIRRALVYRLASRYRLRAQTSSLLPYRRGRAPRSRLLDPEVEALICTVVERIYLQPERPRISDLLRAVETECRQRGLKAPTFHTLQARLRELDQDDLVRRRFGAVAARQRFGPVGCERIELETLNEEVVTASLVSISDRRTRRTAA
jgi:putative transposase